MPIVKDGKLATSCGCCEIDPCSANWQQSLSAISVEIEAEDLFYQYQGTSTADYNDPIFGISHPAGTKHVWTFAWAGSQINGTKTLTKIAGFNQWEYSLPFQAPYCFSQFSAPSNPFGAPRGNYIVAARVGSQSVEVFAGFSGRRELSPYGQDGPASFGDMDCSYAANSLTGESRSDLRPSNSLTWEVGVVSCIGGQISYPALPWDRVVNVPPPTTGTGESALPGTTTNVSVVVPASPSPGLSQNNFFGGGPLNWHQPVFRVTGISLVFGNPLP